MNFVSDQKSQPTKSDEGFPTILLAGDNRKLIDMKRRLELDGNLVLQALDAAEALHVTRVHSRPIHLLLVDVSLDGLAIAEMLKPYMPGMLLRLATGNLENTLAAVRLLLAVGPTQLQPEGMLP